MRGSHFVSRSLPLLALIAVITATSPGASLASPEGAIRAYDADLFLSRYPGEAPDTCGATWDLPTYYLWEFAQRRCEASRCPSAIAPVNGVGVLWFNYGATPAEKNVRIFITDDEAGLPGGMLWELETTTALLDPGETRLVVYPVDPPISSVNALWFGHEELSAGPPSSLFDGEPDGLNMASGPPCGDWEPQELADYLQFLVLGEGSVSVGDGVGNRHEIEITRVLTPTSQRMESDLRVLAPQGVRISLFNAGGVRVRDLLQARLETGTHRIEARITGLPSGVYYLRAWSATSVSQSRLVVVR